MTQADLELLSTPHLHALRAMARQEAYHHARLGLQVAAHNCLVSEFLIDVVLELREEKDKVVVDWLKWGF